MKVTQKEKTYQSSHTSLDRRSDPSAVCSRITTGLVPTKHIRFPGGDYLTTFGPRLRNDLTPVPIPLRNGQFLHQGCHDSLFHSHAKGNASPHNLASRSLAVDIWVISKNVAKTRPIDLNPLHRGADWRNNRLLWKRPWP